MATAVKYKEKIISPFPNFLGPITESEGILFLDLNLKHLCINRTFLDLL